MQCILRAQNTRLSCFGRAGLGRRVVPSRFRCNGETRLHSARVVGVWDGETIRLTLGVQIDLGGIGEEYAVDRTTRLSAEATFLEEQEVQHWIVG